MLINALCEYYDILSETGRLDREGWTKQAVNRLITLRPDGTISAIIPFTDKVNIPQKNGKAKQVDVPRNVLLPLRVQTTKILSYCLDHRSEYIFGLDWDKDNERFCTTPKSLQKNSEFIKTNLDFTEGMTSDAVLAFRNFLNSWKPEEHIDDPVLTAYGKSLFGIGSGCCFALEGLANGLIGNDPQIAEKVEASVSDIKPDGEQVVGNCAVTGESGVPIEQLHGYIKGIRGTNASGGKLVCFNNQSDESFGKTQSYNSSISSAAAKKYTAALNYLIADQNHRIYIDEMTVIFWAMSDNAASDELVCDFFGAVMGKPDSGEVDNALMNAMRRSGAGLSSADLRQLDIDPSVRFYIAGFTPNVSRISMKFCCRSTTAKMLENVAQHQRDLAHDGLSEQPTIWRLTAELYPPSATDKKPSNPLYAALFDSVFNGTRYPRALEETVIRRCKIDKGRISDIRAAIIKACLNRQARLSNNKEVIKMALDKENTSPAYLCGRLFALLEIAQVAAIGKANRTIKDAYFSSAATKPAAVLPRLMMLAQHHIEKADNGGYINRLISETVCPLEGKFPTTLTLDQQGEFIIGYYQQNKDYFTAKSDKTDGKEE
ncbi:MAG: type I-C CRISPR-associated protein Cas8c/Csd1 [Oscillospiraceae bacterium]